MTYKELINQLRNDVVHKFNLYLKADEALSEEGNSTIFLDKTLIESHNKAYHEWQLAQNLYNNTLLLISRFNIDIDKEIVQ